MTKLLFQESHNLDINYLLLILIFTLLSHTEMEFEMELEKWVGLRHMTIGPLCSPSRGNSTATAGAGGWGGRTCPGSKDSGIRIR